MQSAMMLRTGMLRARMQRVMALLQPVILEETLSHT